MKVNKKIKRFIFRTKKELDIFFNVKMSVPKIRLIYSRKECDKLKGKKTESWQVGWADSGKIFIISPEKLAKESCHRKKDFYPILKHEIAHIYYSKITKSMKPIWLNEGLALYLAKQKRKNRSTEKCIKIIDYFNKANVDVYVLGYDFVKRLIEKCGKKKLLKLLNMMKTRKKINKMKFGALFKDIYGFPLTKKELIKRFKSKH